MDQGYDNPLYAALEMDYSDSDEDPTGEAYEKVEKVSSASLVRLCERYEADGSSI